MNDQASRLVLALSVVATAGGAYLLARDIKEGEALLIVGAVLGAVSLVTTLFMWRRRRR